MKKKSITAIVAIDTPMTGPTMTLTGVFFEEFETILAETAELDPLDVND